MKSIDEIFNTMYGAKVWSSLDLESAFWQIRIREEDREKQQLFVKRDCSTLMQFLLVLKMDLQLSREHVRKLWVIVWEET